MEIKNTCKLVWRETACCGKVLKRSIFDNAFSECCERHYQIFSALIKLRSLGWSADKLNKMSCTELIDELTKRERKHGKKILAD